MISYLWGSRIFLRGCRLGEFLLLLAGALERLKAGYWGVFRRRVSGGSGRFIGIGIGIGIGHPIGSKQKLLSFKDNRK